MPSPLTPSDVRRIAALARLDLADAEIDRFAAQLTEILEYAAQLQDVDTADVPPDAWRPRAAPPDDLRADEPRPSLARALVLEQAPAADRGAGFFTVPRVLGP